MLTSSLMVPWRDFLCMLIVANSKITLHLLNGLDSCPELATKSCRIPKIPSKFLWLMQITCYLVTLFLQCDLSPSEQLSGTENDLQCHSHHLWSSRARWETERVCVVVAGFVFGGFTITERDLQFAAKCCQKLIHATSLQFVAHGL